MRASSCGGDLGDVAVDVLRMHVRKFLFDCLIVVIMIMIMIMINSSEEKMESPNRSP